MKHFYHVLINTLIAVVTNNFVWFAVIFWTILETKSVLAPAFASGTYLAATAICGFWFGSIVDHHKKKTAMLLSSIVTLAIFSIGLVMILALPQEAWTSMSNPALWGLIVILLLGVVAGNIRMIALPTLVTVLVPQEQRDKANGLSGSMTGVAFSITSVGSGLAVGYGGMTVVMIIAMVCTLLAIIHLLFIPIPEKALTHSPENPKKIDIKGTIAAITAIPGLFALIFFTTFNNFLGGVFMSLMDAYGLSLVSVQVWGILFAFLSFGFILGGLLIAKKGLGKNPIKTLLLANIIMWSVAAVFTIQYSIVPLAIGILVWITLSPYVEAAEQTVVQKLVPLERQGRVFGFAQSIEQAASPLTAFIIGPIAQFVFIPFMTTGAGVDLIGDWYGTGPARGMALVFTIAGLVGLIMTVLAFQSTYYRQLSKRYLTSKDANSNSEKETA